MQNPPLNDEADLKYYTIATLKQHSRQFDGDLRLISLEFTVLSSTFAVLRAFLNGCKHQKTVRWTLHPFFWLFYCIHASNFFRFDYAFEFSKDSRFRCSRRLRHALLSLLDSGWIDAPLTRGGQSKCALILIVCGV
jgi:hypothetical protein